jgi:hypothetical protein
MRHFHEVWFAVRTQQHAVHSNSQAEDLADIWDVHAAHTAERQHHCLARRSADCGMTDAAMACIPHAPGSSTHNSLDLTQGSCNQSHLHYNAVQTACRCNHLIASHGCFCPERHSALHSDCLQRELACKTGQHVIQHGTQCYQLRQAAASLPSTCHCIMRTASDTSTLEVHLAL